MFIKYLITIIAFSITGIPFSRAQSNIQVGNSPVSVSGDAIYILSPPDDGRRPSGITIKRWKDGSLTSLGLMKSDADNVYAALAIGSSPSGGLYVAFAHHTPHTEPAIVIMDVDYESGTGKEIWRSKTLAPRSFAVSNQGYIYVIGTNISDERENDASRKEGKSGTTMKLLHIFDPAGIEIASLLPVDVARRESISGVMITATFSVKRNGNFVVNFDPIGALADGYQALIAREVTEYLSNGLVVGVHRLPLDSNSVIDSAVFDSNDDLILQVGTHIPTASKQAFRWGGSKVGIETQNSVAPLAAVILSAGEYIIGTLGQNTLVIRGGGMVPNKGYVRLAHQ